MISRIIQSFVAGIVLFIVAFSLGEQFTTRILLAGFLLVFLLWLWAELHSGKQIYLPVI